MAGNNTAGTRVVSNTLSGSTVDLVYLSDPGYGVNVENVSQTANIWFTVSHPGCPCPAPTIGASVGAFCAGSVGATSINVRHAGQFGSIVQLISSGTPTYTVSVIGNQANA